MAFSLHRLHLFLLPFLALIPITNSNLTKDYYAKTCPQFPTTMERIIVDKQMAAPTTAAGILRLFFHDCVVGGCDASLLIASNAHTTAERDAELNRSLPGDAFDLIVRLKTALELECPNTVSCADILAVAARNLVSMVGGPYYEVVLGRKDSLESRASDVPGHIATPYMPMDKIIAVFASKNLTVQELVALSGAHTIGFAHCSEFSHRIFNFSSTSQVL